jgi:hypothetical protein
MRKSSARQNTRSEGGQAGRQIGGPRDLPKPVRIVGYKELRIDLIRNDISIKKLGEEFEMRAGAMCRILKGHHPNSVFVDAVFKRIGVDRDSYFDGVPRKRVLCLEAQAQDSMSAIIFLQKDMLDPQRHLNAKHC